ncbi:MAG: ABC transporter ATP-binding protein [Christensenellales bacterium]
MQLLELHDLRKSFDGYEVLRGITLSVREGEFVTLLGPSGCGKTTTLRIIAGLIAPDAGSVRLEGRDITTFPPEKRDVNTVFQNYALFPHMSVEKNIAYGLKLRGEKPAARAERVREMLKLVRLEGYGKRMPSQLSGGQRQRVAIARAVVLNPRLLLLDEPLGALDLKLRQQMQHELKEIQRELGIAFVYITHDQEEALNMSDRIAIMNGGAFEQIGAPEDIYERPATRFAASFIGQTNLIDCTVASASAGGLTLAFDGYQVPARATPGIGAGDHVALCLRTERVRYSAAPTGACAVPGVLKSRHYAGGSIRCVIALSSGRELIAVGQSGAGERAQVGENVFVAWDPDEAAVVR